MSAAWVLILGYECGMRRGAPQRRVHRSSMGALAQPIGRAAGKDCGAGKEGGLFRGWWGGGGGGKGGGGDLGEDSEGQGGEAGTVAGRLQRGTGAESRPARAARVTQPADRAGVWAAYPSRQAVRATAAADPRSRHAPCHGLPGQQAVRAAAAADASSRVECWPRTLAVDTDRGAAMVRDI